MTPVVVVLPDELLAFLQAELARTGTGTGDAGRYVVHLLETARRQAIEARLDALLVAGLASEVVPRALGADPPISVQRLALEDVAAEADRLAARGLGAIAERFRNAVGRSVSGIGEAGGQGGSAVLASIAGSVAAWPVPGFSDQQVYVVREGGQVRILRVLHRVRDLEAWVARPPESDLRPDQ